MTQAERDEAYILILATRQALPLASAAAEVVARRIRARWHHLPHSTRTLILNLVESGVVEHRAAAVINHAAWSSVLALEHCHRRVTPRPSSPAKK